MGTLTPGATLIYETVAGTIFAREFGKTERKVVGYVTEMNPEFAMYKSEINQILKMCENDPAMGALLSQLLVLYNLKKDHSNDLMWHPV